MQIFKKGDIFADNYQLVRLVDTGGFAEVWEAIFIKVGNTVALKIFPKLDADGKKNIEDEYRNQANLLHSNLVTARNFGIYEGQPYLEMLFFGGGNGSKKISNCDESDIAKCMHQIAGGLAYLHSKEIVHQDIKPNNFLLDEEGNYYLADLGLSVKIRQTIQRFTEAKGANNVTVSMLRNTTGSTPPCYRAPELSDRPSIYKPPIKATDIWSLGASIFEMVYGDVPFGDMGGIIQINHPEPPDLPDLFSPQLNLIVKKCLSKNTWDRPKASELEEWAGNFRKSGTWHEIINPVIEEKQFLSQQPSKSEASKTITAKPQPFIVPSSKSKRGASFVKIISVILIIAILGFGSWYFLISNSGKNTSDTTTKLDTTKLDSTKVDLIRQPNTKLSDKIQKVDSIGKASLKKTGVLKSGVFPLDKNNKSTPNSNENKSKKVDVDGYSPPPMDKTDTTNQ